MAKKETTVSASESRTRGKPTPKSKAKKLEAGAAHPTASPVRGEPKDLQYWLQLQHDNRHRVLETCMESQRLYAERSEETLIGQELRRALRMYETLSVMQAYIIENQANKARLTRMLEAGELDRDSSEELDELNVLEGVLLLNNISLVRCLRNSAHAMGLDPKPFTVVAEDLTAATRANALGLAEQMTLMLQTELDGASPKKLERSEYEYQLTETQQNVLRVMSLYHPGAFMGVRTIHSDFCRTYFDVDDETVRLAIKALIAQELAERPPSGRGARLTKAGRKLAGKIGD